MNAHEVRVDLEPSLSATEFVDVLARSGLGARRPIDDVRRIDTMLRNANLILVARDLEGKLVGVARSVTDFAYCCYLSDLAVDRAWQGKGLGRRLIDETRRAASAEAKLILLSAPDADSYYPHIGMTKATNCWVTERAR